MEIRFEDEYCAECLLKDIYISEAPFSSPLRREFEPHCRHEDICAVWKERLISLHEAMRREKLTSIVKP